MDLNAFETIYELPREITIAELLGRRIFLRVNTFIPKATTIGEVADWSAYAIRFPPDTLLQADRIATSIEYDINYEDATISIKLSQQTTPLEVREFTQYLLNEVTDCLKKNQK